MGILSRIINSPETIPVKRIRASRAMFVSEDIQRVDCDIELPSGDRIRLELSPRQAKELIGNLSAAYNAICPPLKGQGNIFG